MRRGDGEQDHRQQPGRASRELSARISYTYQDYVYDRYVSGDQDVSGNREPGIPPHSVFGQLTNTTPWGLTSALTARWVDSYPVNDDNTASNWAFTVVGFRVSLDREIGRIAARPFAGIDNIFDERYNATVSVNAVGGRYYAPSDGRSFYVGFRLGAGI